MGASIIVAVVLVLMVAEAVRGFLKWNAGGQKDAVLGLAGALPCAAYLLRDYVSDYLLFAVVVGGLAAIAGGYLMVARRASSADIRSDRRRNGGQSDGKLSLIVAVLAADAVAIVLTVAAIGRVWLVIGTFVAINLLALVLVRPGSASSESTRSSS